MTKVWMIMLFISFNHINGQQMELIAGHVLFRHGDRTPITTYPTDPMKEKDWPNGYGKLTTAGIAQQYRLGKYLRTRYGSILSPTYTSSEIYVRSTDYDRTLMSAQSNLIGLYPLVNSSNDSVPIQPIPIHTVSCDQDFLLGINDCPKYDQLDQEIYQKEDFKKLDIYYRPFFQKLEVWTNISNITMYNTWGLGDAIFIEHIYNKTPAWATDEVQKNLSDISDVSSQFLYKNEDSKRIRGGPLIQEIWKNIDNASHGKSSWKVKMYSAHDSTICAVLSFLGINYPHPPPYAAALFFDLYKQNSNYFVKVEYLNVTDSNTPYPYTLNGCPGVECPLEKFTSIYQPRFPSTVDVECGKKDPPTPPSTGGNKKQIMRAIILIVVLCIIVCVICGYLYFQKKEKDPPLLSTEATWEMA